VQVRTRRVCAPPPRSKLADHYAGVPIQFCHGGIEILHLRAAEMIPKFAITFFSRCYAPVTQLK
jgi:hypothetical protein